MDPQNNPQENSQQQGSGLGSGTINNINSGINRYKNFSQNTKNRLARARNFARKLRGKEPIPIPGVPTSIEGVGKAAFKRALFANPAVLVVGILLLFGIVFAITSSTSSPSFPSDATGAGPTPLPGTDPGGIPTSPIPGLDLSLDPPPPSTNNAPITLTIKAEYSQTQDIEIIAPIPPGYNFSTASGTHTPNESFVSWKLSQNTPLPSTDTIKTYVFTFTIIPTATATDINNYTVNARYATAQDNKF